MSTQAVEPGVREHRQFIGGEWVEAGDGRTYEDMDPYTGEVVFRVPAGGRDDARRAIDAAAAASIARFASSRPPAGTRAATSPL